MKNIVGMVIYLLLAACCVMMACWGCTDETRQLEQGPPPVSISYKVIPVEGNFKNFQYTVVKVDGCEYIWYSTGDWQYFLVHKANCPNHSGLLNQGVER